MSLWVPAAGDRPPVGGFGPLDDALEAFDLVPPKRIGSALGHPGDSGREPGDAQHVGRAPFEEERKRGRLGFARRVAAGSTFAPGTWIRPRAHVERPGAGRPIERLVA